MTSTLPSSGFGMPGRDTGRRDLGSPHSTHCQRRRRANCPPHARTSVDLLSSVYLAKCGDGHQVTSVPPAGGKAPRRRARQSPSTVPIASTTTSTAAARFRRPSLRSAQPVVENGEASTIAAHTPIALNECHPDTPPVRPAAPPSEPAPQGSLRSTRTRDQAGDHTDREIRLPAVANVHRGVSQQIDCVQSLQDAHERDIHPDHEGGSTNQFYARLRLHLGTRCQCGAKPNTRRTPMSGVDIPTEKPTMTARIRRTMHISVTI